MKLLIILLLVFFSILILLYLTSYNYENFDTNDKNIEIVIARYNEDLEWLKNEPFNKFPVTIYNKGLNHKFYNPPLLKNIIDLSNVGMCDHTYLYHIINNYDNLADITIFLPGSCMDAHKNERTQNVMYKTIETKNTTIYANYINNGLKNELYDFKLDKWLPSNSENNKLNNDDNLVRCNINPFGKWFENNFDNIDVNYVTYMGIFSVSKEHILNRNKESYEELIQFINKNKNEECSHYIERSYIAIFHPIPNECIY